MGLRDLPLFLSTFWPETGTWLNASRVGHGHIHLSFRLETEVGVFFLQQFNSQVFQQPEVVANTLRLIGTLSDTAAIGSLPAWIPTKTGEAYATSGANSLWRLFPWLEHASTPRINTEAIGKAAFAFGAWTKQVNQLDVSQIQAPITGFHHLPASWMAMTSNWNTASGTRKFRASETYTRLGEGAPLLRRYERLTRFLPLRIIHADAKIDNLLFDSVTHEPSFVVDLDTVMPGYLWMDLGDMIRSMACSLPEGDPNISEVAVVPEIMETIFHQYQAAMTGWITEAEQSSLLAGAELILFEQALRFLADFLAGDLYYPISYPEENLVRAQNQLMLWESYRGIIG
ncbi:MAG: aminoglycoside phosphotransferase family protein [Bacteroidia bacterium]|nr:aminoglycoside phosphotransferase family protein [Bacteroidia bacterium]